MNISEHITYTEATRSDTANKLGIDNTPNIDQLKSMKLAACRVFEPVRNHFGKPIRINSFFRSQELNKAIGGARNSQHMKGEAIDMSAIPSTGLTNSQIFNWIKDNLEFDQLIWEYGNINNPAWVHVSFSAEKNRNQILYIR